MLFEPIGEVKEVEVNGKMCVRCTGREISCFFAHKKGDKRKSEQVHNHHQHEKIGKRQGSPTPHWENGNPISFLVSQWREGLPYLLCMRKNKRFQWSAECEEAFRELKEYLSNPSVFCRPILGRLIRLYLCVAKRVINSIIVQDNEKG